MIALFVTNLKGLRLALFTSQLLIVGGLTHPLYLKKYSDLVLAKTGSDPVIMIASEPVLAADTQENLHVEFYADGTEGHAQFLNVEVDWSSDDPAVATVEDDGLLRAHADGSALITAEYDGLFDTALITVAGQSIQYSVTVLFVDRTYTLYVPEGYTGLSPVPLLINYHGVTGNAYAQTLRTQMNRISHEQGFLIAYPDGRGGSWNAGGCCGYAELVRSNDVLFTEKMINQIQSNYAVDANRIYAAGFSNGAMMVHRLGCELSGRIAAIAPVSGGMYFGSFGNFTSCNPSDDPVPVFEFHGLTDDAVPFHGGTAHDFRPIPEVIEEWEAINAVTAPAYLSYQNGIVECLTKPYYPVNREVTLCTVDPGEADVDEQGALQDGGGHAWPGGVRLTKGGDVPTRDINASQEIWNFFRGYSRNPEIALTASSHFRVVRLEWHDTISAAEPLYSVYRSQSPGGPYVKISSQKSNVYMDSGLEPGVRYYYAVTKQDADLSVAYSNEEQASARRGSGSGPGIDNPQETEVTDAQRRNSQMEP